MRKSKLSLFLTGICLLVSLTACEKRTIYGGSRALLEHLRPGGSVTAAALHANASIQGQPSQEDLLAVRTLIARVPEIDDEISAMWFWEGMAVRVQLKRYMIYCAKNIDGVWQFTSIGEWHS